MIELFAKYAGIAFAVQVLLLISLGLLGNLISPALDFLFELFFKIYQPFILLVAEVGKFKGESAMIEPVWMGITIGVLFYAFLLGFRGSSSKKRRTSY
jgi:hypothetical protein